MREFFVAVQGPHPQTKRHSWAVSTPALYWRGPGFKSRPGVWMSQDFLQFFSVPTGKFQHSALN
jgi:hypothetical protein